MRVTFKVASLLAWIAAMATSIPTARAADCDRECLRGVITQYLNAMVAHKPAALKVSDKVRFTENTVTMKLGDGLWKTASGIGTYRQDILDVAAGNGGVAGDRGGGRIAGHVDAAAEGRG